MADDRRGKAVRNPEQEDTMRTVGSPIVACSALLVLALTACSDGPVAPFDASLLLQRAPAAAVEMTFAKQFTGDFANGPWVWEGIATLPDGREAALVSTIDLAQIRAVGSVLHAPIHWTMSGDFAMELLTEGIINLQNGIVRTNGRVLGGEYAGAAVHQEGQLVGLDASGFFRINPPAVR
jgi:hypothetical protein